MLKFNEDEMLCQKIKNQKNFLIKRRLNCSLKGCDIIKLKNWMSNLDDFANIKNINIPGAHDSATRYSQFSLFSSCQNLSVRDMLEIGVRAFDLRVNGENAVHAFCKCKKLPFGADLKFYDVISDLYSFLSENPSEALILFFKNEGKISGEKCISLLKALIDKTPEMWYTENAFPMLSQVKGKIILANRINSSIGIDFSKMPHQGSNESVEAEIFSPNVVDTVLVQDRYNLKRSTKWEKAFMPILSNEAKYKEHFVFNHLSCSGLPFIPRFNSRYLNRKFERFKLKQFGHYGTVMIDHVNMKISEKIIMTNF